MLTTPITITVDEPMSALLEQFLELQLVYTRLFLQYSAQDVLGETMPPDLAEAFAKHDEVMHQIVGAIGAPIEGDIVKVKLITTHMWLDPDEELPVQKRLPDRDSIYYFDSVSRLADDYKNSK